MSNKNKKVEEKYEEVVKAADALLQGILSVLADADFQAVFAIAQAHKYVYQGPQLKTQIDGMITALNNLRGNAQPEQQQKDNVVPFEQKLPATKAVDLEIVDEKKE